MPDIHSRLILAHLSDRRYRPSNIDDLAQELGVEPDQRDAFRAAVQELLSAGQVVLGDANTVVLPPPGRQILGSFRLNPRGFGFIIPDSPIEHGDLFVPPGSTMGALTGDRVRANVSHQPRRQERWVGAAPRSPYLAQIVEIVQRAENRYVGSLLKRGNTHVVQVDGQVLQKPVIIRDVGAKNAQPGQKVVIELLRYPSDDDLGEGVILEVLGEAGEPDVETAGVMRAYGLKEGFPAEVMAEARAASAAFNPAAAAQRENLGHRVDLTGELILTIDPPDAKDYDDAISLRRIAGDPKAAPGAAYELGVHIADVSHFVVEGQALDTEARKRGNSTYLPRKVIPMLPEVLSNGVCSLQEGVPRYCISAFMQYDVHGQVLRRRIERTVIRSAKRLTYLEAQALIDDDIREACKHAKSEPKYPRPVIEQLKLMNELALIIRQRRLDAGMIVLDLPEVELVYDESGRVIDAQPQDDAFTHRIIEMFMVEANEAAAVLFDSLRVPMIRRIHPDPPVHDTSELRQFARVAGFNIPARPSKKELQQLLDAVRDKPAKQAVHLAVLRTLSKAEYSPLIIGHFALASEHYTHFTSPIRRYPDLIVHRGLAAYLKLRHELGENPDALGRELASLVPHEQAMTEHGRHCSTTERNSEAAESALRTFLVLDLLSQRLGEDYAGTVTGVTNSGLFVQIDRYLVDGFVTTQDLASSLGSPGEIWRLNRATGALVAQRSGRAITIGDRFTVRVVKVDPPRRQLELVIIEQRGQGGPKKKKIAKVKPHKTSKRPQQHPLSERPHPRPKFNKKQRRRRSR